MFTELPTVNPNSAAKELRLTWYSWMESKGINTLYCPEPYSFSPPSIVDRLLRPLLPPIEKPVVPNPVKPGCWVRVADALDTPGRVKTFWVKLREMLGRFSTWIWFIVFAFWVGCTS